jgi:hypothetical protein
MLALFNGALGLVTGTAGKYILYAGLAVTLAGGAAVLKHEYDASIIASVAAKQAAANLVIERADNARIIAELQTRAITAETEAANYASIKGAIAHAKASSACASSPAMRAALDGLRGNSGNH